MPKINLLAPSGEPEEQPWWKIGAHVRRLVDGVFGSRKASDQVALTNGGDDISQAIEPEILLDDEDPRLLEETERMSHLHEMTEEDEVLSKERLPETGDMRRTKRDERIWLTREAVMARLEVLLHTHPVFNSGGLNTVETRVRELPDGTPITERYSAGNFNIKPTEDQLVDIFRRAGFTFGTRDGKEVMYVDAVVSGDNNASGRIGVIEKSGPALRTLPSLTLPPHESTTSQALAPSRGRVVYQMTEGVLVPTDKQRIGFQPVGEATTHYISIPVDEIVKISHEARALETMYFTPAESTPNEMELLNRRGWNNVHSIYRFFNMLSRHSQYQDRLKSCNKEQFFDLLQELGVEMHIRGGGYFPFEPDMFFTDVRGHTLKDGERVPIITDDEILSPDFLRLSQQRVHDEAKTRGGYFGGEQHFSFNEMWFLFKNSDWRHYPEDEEKLRKRMIS